MPYTVEVDFDVYKTITARRASEAVTENDVLRDLLGLGPANAPNGGVKEPSPPPSAHAGDWVAKGVRFPAGTDFRAKYKGQTYVGRVQGGSLVVNGKPFESPSAAAVAITKNPVNGWRFWECRLPGKSSWQMIETLRR